MAVAPERIYQAVKSGRVKIDQLNDESKQALNGYLQAKKTGSITPTTPTPAIAPEPKKTKLSGVFGGYDTPMDYLDNTFLGSLFGQASEKAGKTSALINSPIQTPSSGNKTADKIAQGAGSVLGLFAPGPGGVSAPARGLFETGEKIGATVAPKLAAKVAPKAAKAVTRAVKGGAALGTYGAGESFAQGEGPLEVLKQGAMGAGVGAGLGVAGGAIADKVKPVFESLSKRRFPASVTAEAATAKEIPKAQPKKIVKSATGGTAETFRSKINRTPTKTGSVSGFIKNMRTQFVDDLAPLERLEKDVTGSVASAEKSLYKQGRLFKGTPTKANEIVRSRLEPVIKGVESKGYTYQDLGDYALAVHARDLEAKGIKTGFTAKEINEVISRFGAPELEAARKELLSLSDDMLKTLADAEVISQKTVQTLKAKHPNYMPFFRSFDDEKIEFTRGLSKSLANVTSPIKQIKGSDRNVIDPIESMIKNVFQATSAADRNKVALQLANLAEKDTGTLIHKLAEGETVGRKNVVNVLRSGEKVSYEVDPEVYRALLNLDKESGTFLVNILSKPASVLRAGATLTPEFALRNPMRDVVQAYIVSKSGFNPLLDVPAAIFNIAKKGQLYKQFLQDNAGYGNIVSMDRNLHREVLDRIIKQPVTKQFINIINPRSWVGVLRKLTDATETATKLGEYRAALRSGASREEAAYRARDLMDFARAGYSVRSANKMIAFLNANIQGKSKLIRAIKENPKGVTVKTLQAVTLPTIGEYLAQKYLANEEQKAAIKDAPEWMKNTFWLVPIPETNLVARIPKPFDLAIFANFPARALDYVFENDPKAFDNFARQTFSQMSIPVMLTGFTPIVEGMANYSFFREGPIIPRREEGVNYPEQKDVNTSEVAKASANIMSSLTGGEGPFKNFGSPRVTDYTIKGFTAGLGTIATDAIDVILRGVGAAEQQNKAQMDVSQIPILKAFLVNRTGTGQSMDDLYSTREKLTREKGSAKLNLTPFVQEGTLKYTEKITEKIGDISKRMRQIENDQNLDPKTKREMLMDLNKLRNELARTSAQNI